MTNNTSQSGFTLIETMAAVTLLALAIVSPMLLTAQSLQAAYYARDQVTAFYLAQEALETVRSVRDANVLANSLNQTIPCNNGTGTGVLCNIPVGTPFVIDATKDPVTDLQDLIQTCAGACSSLKTDGTLYGYSAGWTPTMFTRTVVANYVQYNSVNNTDEIRVQVTISWQTAGFQTRTFTLSEDMYNWVIGGSGSKT